MRPRPSAARTPAVFALQAFVTAGLIDIDAIPLFDQLQRFYELRPRRFVALLVAPTLFLRVQPKPRSARENDIAVKDTPLSSRHACAISLSVACAWRCANSSNAAPCNCGWHVCGSARGARLPVCSRNAIQRSMVGRLMRNNRCAVILLMPASSDAKTRSRKSMLYPLDIQPV